MNGIAYSKKEDQARGQGDLTHAYDGVQQWAVDVVLMGVGMPEEDVQYQTKLAALSRSRGRLWSLPLESQRRS